MNILHVVASVDSKAGGVAESILSRGLHLQECGHNVEVVCTDSPHAASKFQYPLRLHALGPGHTAWNYTPRLLPWLLANYRRFDAIIVDGIWQYHGSAVRKALRGTDVPYLVFPHGMLDPWFKRTYPWKHFKKWLFWPWADYRVLRDAHAVLFTCEEERNLARTSFWLYSVRERVVPFGASAPPRHGEHLRAQFLNRFPELANKKILLFLGRVHPKKGCDILIDAFANIAGADISLHLAIAGPVENHLKEELMKRSEQLGVAARVHWLGMLEGETKWGAFYSSDAFALPSHQENFGIAVVEAMACGLPVIISNKVNIWREISQGDAGYVEEDSAAGTERSIRCWLGSSPERLETKRRAALDVYCKKFTIKAMAEGLLTVIRESGVSR